MNDPRRDTALVDWLAEGPSQGSVQSLERALAATRRVRQRPAWTFPVRWLPARLTQSDVGAGRLALVGLLLVLTLLTVVALASTFFGSARRVPSPLGWSGDRPLAYEAADGIYAARSDGTDRRKLSGSLDGARSPVFSPEGTSIAFVAHPPGGGGWRLYVAPADAASEPVEVGGGREVAPDSAAPISWAPDGRRLAFAVEDGGVRRIFVVDTDGGRLAPITDSTADSDLPSWSPDGRRIAWRTIDPDGQRTYLRTALSDGSDVQDVALVIAPDASVSRLSWSPTGVYAYAFGPGFGSPTSALVDLGAQHTVEVWTEGVGGEQDLGVPLSPDGKQVAILTANDGVVIADTPTADVGYDLRLRRLGPILDCWIAWSPDGTALYGGSPDGCGQVAVVPLSDPEAAIRLPGSAGRPASWQPTTEP